MRTKDFDTMLAEFDKKRPDLAAHRTERVERQLLEHDAYQQVLAKLRKASHKTQAEVARALGISQPRVSELEKSRDLYLSTFTNFVTALGGELEFVVTLDGQRIAIAAEDVLGRAADATPEVISERELEPA